MITKKIIKSEIDKIQDQYLEILYQIIKAFEISSEGSLSESESSNDYSLNSLNKKEWHEFIDKFYGCLSDAPIYRGNQENLVNEKNYDLERLPAYGMWKDRIDIVNSGEYARELRKKVSRRNFSDID